MSSPVASRRVASRSWTDQNYISAPRTLRSIQKIPSSKNKEQRKTRRPVPNLHDTTVFI